MATINKDTPCLFITTVTRNRLPVFRTDALKGVACSALDEARRSGGFALFAYVIMPEHLHVRAAPHGPGEDSLAEAAIAYGPQEGVALALNRYSGKLPSGKAEPFRKSGGSR